MLTRERLRELIDQHGLTDRADELMAALRPSIHLKLRYDVDEANIPIGASKMGGSPDVPEGFEFPMWKDRYLSFIAQIRLSDAKPYDLEDLLPLTGILYFFFETSLYFDEPYEKLLKPSDCYRVLYVENETLPLHRMQHPISEFSTNTSFLESLSPSLRAKLYDTHVHKTDTFQACPIQFEQEWTPLSLLRFDWSKDRSSELGSPEYERFWGEGGIVEAVDKVLAKPMHRLLGESTDIQTGYSLAKDSSQAWNLGTADDWTLLLQVDSDDWKETQHKPGFMWGDAGLIYFCVNKEDMRAGRFDRIWLDLICY